MRKSFLLLALLAVPGVPAWSCASIVSTGEDVVQTTDESAIILWDAANHEEHFIRRANFQTKAKNFGFLVPTPSQPKLSEVNDGAFRELQSETQPKVVTKTHWHFSAASLFMGGQIKNTFNTAAGSINILDEVSVLETKKLGNYDVAVLWSRNAAAVSRWLKKHGYPSGTTLSTWMKPYAAKNWVLTAFKVNREAGGDFARLTAFRMSFKTYKPFYPYKEPAQATHQSNGSRFLRVYFLSDSRVQGNLESSAQAWRGEELWNGDISASSAKVTAQDLRLDESLVNRLNRMTVFRDTSSPRHSFADVYFTPNEDQATNTPPPIIKWQNRTLWIPFEALIICAVGMAYLVTARLKPKKQ